MSNFTLLFSILTGVAVKSVILLTAAWIAVFGLRRHSAAARHLIWTAAFAAILALPFLSAALPVLRVPFSSVVLPPTRAQFHATAGASADRDAARASAPGDAASEMHPGPWHPDWGRWLLLLWAAGAAAALGRTLMAYGIALRMRRSASPSLNNALGGLARTLGIRRAVEVLETEPGSMPIAFGMRRPVVLIPADAAAWNESKRRVVLLHELAHVRRGDAATHLLARVAADLYWWNPLAWIAWREFLKERERAADDLVLQAGACASEYAGHLLDVARTMQSPASIAWAAPGMARTAQLEGRLLAILDSGVNRAAPSRSAILAVAIVAVALVAPVAAVRAQEASPQSVPADVDAAIRTAQSQNNYEALEAAAKAATLSHQLDTAQRLLEAAVAIRAQAAGKQSVEYGVGLEKLAELEQKREPNSGVEMYTQAAQIMGEHPEAARALTRLGLAALGKHDYPPAFAYFQHAQQVDPAHAGTALMWMAVVRQAEHKMDDAERLYQSALAAQDPRSFDAAVGMAVYAQFLRVQGLDDQAGDFEARAASICTAAAAPTLPAGVYHVSKGSVSAPGIVQKVDPEYSEEARAARLQGTVVVEVVIGVDGRAHNPRIARGLGLGLDENAIEAINQWQFKPGLKDDQPVKVAATIEVNFRLL